MQPIGSRRKDTKSKIKSVIVRILTFLFTWIMLAWALWALGMLSLTVVESNDTIGLSLLGALVLVTYIVFRKEIAK